LIGHERGAAAVKDINPTGTVCIAAAFFDTSISVIEYADPDLHPESDQTPSWPFHIELAASGKLKK
jgi:hypothetical protein